MLAGTLGLAAASWVLSIQLMSAMGMGVATEAVAAWVLTAIADGTAIHWSTCLVGSLRARMRADLEAVLAGWRRDPYTPRGGSAP